MPPLLLLVVEITSEAHPAPYASTTKKYVPLVIPPEPLDVGRVVSLRTPKPPHTAEQAILNPGNTTTPLAVVGRIVGERATKEGEIELVVKNEAPNPRVKYAHIHIRLFPGVPGGGGIASELTRRLAAVAGSLPDRNGTDGTPEDAGRFISSADAS
ncbi:hypothetical protein OH77DRAFT_1230337 [Trametes cingulata]|nr:hypothetical protein OH77DRAFT_1230337 [Trametes cingulata]